MHGDERLDEGRAFRQTRAELASSLGAHADDVLQADRLGRQFLADGPAEEADNDSLVFGPFDHNWGSSLLGGS